MTVEDLIDVKTSRVVRPRPPTLTSIPSLLSVFQNEWDAFALESYNLRQQLGQTRQELATALYQHDAAIRVIARLTKERDEARDALSKVTIGAGASNGDAMQVDSAGLPEELVEKIDATHEKYAFLSFLERPQYQLILCRLSKSRRKRAVPKEWATPEAVESYIVTSSSEALYPSTTTLALDTAGELAIVGGAQGAGVLSISENKLVQQLNIGRGSVTDAVWYGSQPVVATSAGAIKVFNDGQEVASFTSHAGAANALALHPTGDILASVGVDKSFVFYDLVASKPVAQVYTDNGTSLFSSPSMPKQ
jgi:pre-mRNA-processing factor 19